jgi:hypothetical protein
LLLLLLLLSLSLMGCTRSSNLELCNGERKNTPRPVGSSWIFLENRCRNCDSPSPQKDNVRRQCADVEAFRKIGRTHAKCNPKTEMKNRGKERRCKGKRWGPARARARALTPWNIPGRTILPGKSCLWERNFFFWGPEVTNQELLRGEHKLVEMLLRLCYAFHQPQQTVQKMRPKTILLILTAMFWFFFIQF